MPGGKAPWLLLGLAAVAYANSFAGVFQFDDHAAIVDDARLQSLAAFAEGVGQAIRPFAKATFLLDRSLHGVQPAGYHVLNVLLHLASGTLLYRILCHRGFHGSDPRIAFWTTALFLLHPMATETVTYISGRPTGLMTCAYLAAYLLFLEARTAEPASPARRRARTAAAACLALSLLAKEVAIVFPALLLLHEAVIGRPARRAVPGLLWRVHLPLSAVVVLFLGCAWLHARYAYLLHYSVQLRGVGENLLAQANAVAYAITLFVRPAQLNFDHDLPATPAIPDVSTLLAVAALAALLAGAVALARRAPLFSFGVLWFFVHLLPTNSVLPRYDLLSERNLYLPSIGLYLAATVCVLAFARRLEARIAAGTPPRAVVRALLAAGLLGLAGLTIARNTIYADPVAFWSDAVDKSPRKARPHTNLGHAWFLAGEPDRAMEQFRIALALDPLDEAAQRNLLQAWTRSGKL